MEMDGEKIEKIRYNNPVYLEEKSKVANMEYYLTNPFPKDKFAANIFLKLISRNHGFSTHLSEDYIILNYKGEMWTPQIIRQLEKIVTFALYETRRLMNKIGEHELTRGF